MADYFEIDFLEVHTTKSGDAIGIRYELGGLTYIHAVDGGYSETGPKLAQHIREFYGNPTAIDYVVVTHPDQDHASGVQAILDEFDVGELWMLCPWHYAEELIGQFPAYTSADNLKRKLRDAYPYIDALEKLAIKKGIPIREPFQGQTIGAFTVMAPSRARYLRLVVDSEKTPRGAPQSLGEMLSSFGTLALDAAKKAIALVRSAWGAEVFSSEDTSVENEMSVIQYAQLCGKKILLTGDAGRDALAEAADYAPYVGLALPGIDRFQVPHHGGRRNVSTEILDRWLGPRLQRQPAEGAETFTALISAGREDEDHPRKSVVRAMIHRGAKVVSTGDGHGTKRTSRNAPSRGGWSPASLMQYPESQEED